jgi:hypothetical protein
MAEETKSKKLAGKKWIVSCECPTPLNAKTLEVEADSEDEALEVFKSHNGLSGTDHPITIQAK